MKGLKFKFSGTDPADVKDWRKETCLILSIDRKELVGIMQGNHRPAEGTTATSSTTDESTTAPHTLEQAQATYDKASQDLYPILYLFTEKPAQLLVLNHEDETGIGATARTSGRSWNQSF